MSDEQTIPTNFFELIANLTPTSFDAELRDWTQGVSSIENNDFTNMFSSGFIFKQYGSFEEAFEVITEARKVQNPPSWMKRALAYVSDEEYETLESTIDFMNLPDPSFEKAKEVADSIIGNVKELINLGGTFSNDRIIISEDKKGIFDFSLASKGLFRPVEFYSADYKKAVENGKVNEYEYLGEPLGVIPNISVDNVENEDGSKTFFVIISDRQYLCQRRQKGATLVFNTYPDECVLKQNNQGIELTYEVDNQEKVFNGKGGVMLKYASSNKKSYLIYEKKPESTRYVDIFIPVNYVGVSDGNRILNLLTPILVSASLEQFGIQTRISAVRNGSNDNVFTAISLPLKTYEETTSSKMDFILNMLGKTDVAGSLFAFFKVYVSNSGEQKDKYGNPVISGNTSSSFSSVKYYLKSFSDALFIRYKNWISANKDQSFVNTRVTNDNFQILTFQAIEYESGVNFFPQNTRANTSALLNQMGHSLFMFYYYMDFLSIEFNTMENLANAVMVRLEEDENFRKIFNVPKERSEKKKIVRQYLTSIITGKYSYATEGAYHDTKLQIKEKQDSFDKKLKEMNETLKLL